MLGPVSVPMAWTQDTSEGVSAVIPSFKVEQHGGREDEGSPDELPIQLQQHAQSTSSPKHHDNDEALVRKIESRWLRSASWTDWEQIHWKAFDQGSKDVRYLLDRLAAERERADQAFKDAFHFSALLTQKDQEIAAEHLARLNAEATARIWAKRAQGWAVTHGSGYPDPTPDEIRAERERMEQPNGAPDR